MILLIHPPFGDGNTKRPPEIFDPTFPWGLGYISGMLTKAGYDLQLLDIYAHQLNKAETLDRLRKLKFQYVFISAMCTQYAYIKWLTKEIKRINPNCWIILGGQLATFSYTTALAHTHTDICVLGEGELAAVEILEQLQEQDHVPQGIAFKYDNKLEVHFKRPVIENIDDIPAPNYDLFPMDIYKRTKLYIHNTSVGGTGKDRPNVIGMLTGRGCPYRCGFCSRTWRSIRFRSLKSILYDIDYFIERYNIKGINFLDELLFFKNGIIDKLAPELGKRNLIWNGNSRIDTINTDNLKLYKDNGMVSLSFGVETGSDKLLKAMGKGITRSQIETTLSKVIANDIHLRITLIFGFPGETKETVQETINMFKRLNHTGRRFCIFTPLPGSEIYSDAIERGIIKDEDEYLTKIGEGFWKRTVNMTDFTDAEFDTIREEAERDMGCYSTIEREFIDK